MGKLIDADKLLADLKDKKKSLRESLNWVKREGETKWADELREQMQILSLIIYGVEHGGYDPDPTPKYRVVLYNLKNGLEKLESEIMDKRPSDEEAEMGRILYGAERFEIVEVRE